MIDGSGRSTYRRTQLENGLRIVTEAMPQVRSIAIGFWFNTGSRDEPEDLAGISHFLEHMNFKGTGRRNPAAIARQIEERGGHLNAFTSKEFTCYHARIVDQQIGRAVDVLDDITRNSIFDQKEINRERGVIFEELKNLEDTPDELVFEHFFAQLYNPHAMGRSILGKRETLESIKRAELVDYRDHRYNAPLCVIAAAGNINHDRLVRMFEKLIQTANGAENHRLPPDAQAASNPRLEYHTNTQQAHICWGCKAFRYADERKYPLLVLHTLLGSGMSSRLFQRIREKHGLAYSVFSFIETYFDTGLFGVYAGTEPKQAEKALKMILDEVEKLTRKSISQSLLQRTKDQLKGNLVLGLESVSARMHRLAKMELYDAGWHSIDDVIRQIDGVTAGDVKAVAEELFGKNQAVTTMLLPN